MTSHRDPAPGALVDNRYRLVAPLGEGTFGAVWRAQDTRLSGRAVAVKFLKPEFLAHPEAVTRFEAEADALAQVQHPNVVGVHDRGQWGDTHYLVTEFVEGRPLTAWIEDHRARRSYPDVDATLHLFDQVCAGLEAAHAVRAPGPIVHRDLKPENILVRVQSNGEPLVKILDFGIAQLGGRTGTRTGALMGTPLYMAPEQALGNTAAIAPSTDVFALGVVLAEMLTLRAQVDVSEPWWGTTMQRGPELRGLLAAMRADVPSHLYDVIAKALSSRRTDRYADAGALRMALRSVGSTSVAAIGMASTQMAPRAQPPLGLPATVVGGPPQSIARTVLSVPPPVANSSTAPMMREVVGPRPRPVGLLGGVVAGVAIIGFAVAVAVHRGSDGAAATTATISDRSTPAAIPGPTPQTVSAIVPPARLPTTAAAVPASGPSVAADAALSSFFRGWSAAVVDNRAAVPLDGFYAGAVQFRRSGNLATAADVARYYALGYAQGDTLAFDWNRSDWLSESLTSPDAARACVNLPDAIGPIIKVRAWATEVAPGRAANSNGDVPCDRLEGRYLFRLRRVGGALRICHETWSLREGVCASCSTARACQTLAPAQGCTYATHSTFHLRATEVLSRDGAEEIATRPQLQVVRAGSLRRGIEGSFYVRFLDGTQREGWVFIPLGELGAGCPTM